MKKFGAKPTPLDPRDYRMSSILPPATTVTKKMWEAPIRLNQYKYGTCVTNAWTHYLTSKPITHTDRKNLDPAEQPDKWWRWDGTFMEYGAEFYAIKMYDTIHNGILEPLDPERSNGCQTMNGAVVLKRRGLVGNYYRALAIDEVVQAVLTMGPVVLAVPWYGSMYGTTEYLGRERCPVDTATLIRGYHAVLVDGVDVSQEVWPGLRVLNSWGKSWGNEGHAWFTMEDLQKIWIQNAWIAGEIPTE